MFIAALLVKSKTCQQPKDASDDEWIKKYHKYIPKNIILLWKEINIDMNCSRDEYGWHKVK